MTPIPFAEGYSTNRVGDVFSSRKGAPRKLKPQLDQDGYLRISLVLGGRQLLIGIHRIVCVTFNGPPPSPGMLVRHLDDVKTNNAPENLAWGKPLDNTKDMFRNGGHRSQRRPESYGASPKISESKRRYWQTHERPAGSLNPIAILTEDKIPVIRRLARDGMSHREIAASFGVSRSAITLIIRGRSWKHVPIEASS